MPPSALLALALLALAAPASAAPGDLRVHQQGGTCTVYEDLDGDGQPDPDEAQVSAPCSGWRHHCTASECVVYHDADADARWDELGVRLPLP